eukprot:1074608-Rhodomonas_salina.5
MPLAARGGRGLLRAAQQQKQRAARGCAWALTPPRAWDAARPGGGPGLETRQVSFPCRPTRTFLCEPRS